MMKGTRNIVFLILIPLFIISCARFIKLKQALDETKESHFLTGTVTVTYQNQGTIIAVIFSENGGKKEIFDYSILPETRRYVFFVPKGKYYIFAFEDTNKNLIYDKSEFGGQYGKPDPVLASSSRKTEGLDIVISNKRQIKYGFPIDLTTFISQGVKYAAGFGTVVDLDNKVFAKSYGSKGLWQPAQFLKEVFGGVYFLEEYDSKKIPIVFVHGSGGTPRDWAYFLDNMDRSRYQPWLFYYPSGARLESMGKWLNRQITELHDKYKFQKLYVTGYSLGGLVARSFISRNFHEDNEDYIKLFISISTPWGGHKGAEFGAKNAPVAVPSWQDLAPESEFLKSLFRRTFPSTVKYYLLFGYKGMGIPLRDNNDGSITIESALSPKAQSEAVKVYGFNEDHVSILYSDAVLMKFNQLLISMD